MAVLPFFIGPAHELKFIAYFGFKSAQVVKLNNKTILYR